MGGREEGKKESKREGRREGARVREIECKRVKYGRGRDGERKGM